MNESSIQPAGRSERSSPLSQQVSPEQEVVLCAHTVSCEGNGGALTHCIQSRAFDINLMQTACKARGSFHVQESLNQDMKPHPHRRKCSDDLVLECACRSVCKSESCPAQAPALLQSSWWGHSTAGCSTGWLRCRGGQRRPCSAALEERADETHIWRCMRVSSRTARGWHAAGMLIG